MRQKIVYWFLRWAINHYGELWTISYTRMYGLYQHVLWVYQQANRGFGNVQLFQRGMGGHL